MAEKVQALMFKLSTVELPRPSNFILAVRQGKITDDIFEEHGPAMALQWVLGYEDGARKKQKKVDKEEADYQAEMAGFKVRRDVREAAARLEHIKACRAAGIPVDITEDDDFDPFPDEIHPPMSHVDWDDGIVASIREPIDPKLPQWGEAERAWPDRSSFWISAEQVFKVIFMEDETEEDPSQGMVMLTHLAERSL